jgi:hypothetical protein
MAGVQRRDIVRKLVALVVGCTLAFAAAADTLECTVTDKTENAHKISKQPIAAGKYSYQLDNDDQKPFHQWDDVYFRPTGEK